MIFYFHIIFHKPFLFPAHERVKNVPEKTHTHTDIFTTKLISAATNNLYIVEQKADAELLSGLHTRGYHQLADLVRG